MKLRKFLAGAVAGLMAVGTMATAANALFYIPTEGLEDSTQVGTDMWLIQIFNDGTGDAAKPATDYGIDLETINSVQFTVKPHSGGDFEYDPIAMPDDSAWGGGIVISCGGYVDPETGENVGQTGPKNWCQVEWWGMREMSEPTKALITVPTENENEWTITYANIPEEHKLVNGSTYAQIALKDWGSSMIELEVSKLVLYDADNKPIIAFDGLGNVIEETAELVDKSEERRAIVEAFKAEEGTLPEMAEPGADEGEGDADASEGADADADADADASADADADAETTTVAPVTGDDGNNTTTTIIVVVCVVVVLAVVIIVVVAKKKK